MKPTVIWLPTSRVVQNKQGGFETAVHSMASKPNSGLQSTQDSVVSSTANFLRLHMSRPLKLQFVSVEMFETAPCGYHP